MIINSPLAKPITSPRAASSIVNSSADEESVERKSPRRSPRRHASPEQESYAFSSQKSPLGEIVRTPLDRPKITAKDFPMILRT